MTEKVFLTKPFDFEIIFVRSFACVFPKYFFNLQITLTTNQTPETTFSGMVFKEQYCFMKDVQKHKNR